MIRRRFRVGTATSDVEGTIREEIDFHLERAVEGLMADGMDRAAAEEEARRRFGDLEAYREKLEAIERDRARGRRRADALGAAAQALRFAVRGLRRSPGPSAAIVLTLALGIGANATMFGVADRLLLSPPDHVADADRVVRVMVERISPFTARPVVSGALTWPDLRDFEEVDAFRETAGFSNARLTLGSGGEAEEVRVQWAGGGLFDLLGVRAHRGRFFGPADDVMEAGGAPAVLSHGFWSRRFARDPGVLGRELHLGQARYTVVGVAPPGFTGPTLESVDVWIPLLPAAVAEQGRGWEDTRRWYWLQAVARLAPGVTPEAASDQATAVHRAGRADEVSLGRYDADASVVLGSLVAGRSPEPGTEVAVSRWLVAMSALVLLIACANVANLLLARSARTGRELAVRVALGVGRGRLLGQLLTESLLLATLSGLGALALARWGGGLLYRFLLPGVDPGTSLGGPDLLAFTATAVLVATALSGLLPAVRASRPDVVGSLKEGSSATGRAGRARAGLLVLQIGLCTVLLFGAGLFVRSLQQAHRVELGFEPDGVVYATAETSDGRFTDRSSRAVSEAAERLRGRPGVEAVAVSSLVPFAGLWGRSLARSPGDTLVLERGPYYYVVTAEYFDVMGMRVLRGRGLEPGDEVPGAPPVTVVTEDLARRLFGATEAVGRCVLVEQRSGPPPCTRIVGVLADHRISGLAETESPVFYVTQAHPASETTPPQTLVAAASGGDTGRLVGSVRRALLAGGAEVRYARVAPLAATLDPETRAWRLGAAVFLVFGGLATVVALVGLYALVSFDLARRRTELGIRAALGAPAARLARATLGRASAVAGIGTLLGLSVAVPVGRAMAGLLYEIPAWDAPTLVTVATTMIVATIMATAVPAWRASRTDPARALRSG